MKNLNPVNGILLIAVAILYYLHFSADKVSVDEVAGADTVEDVLTDSTGAPIVKKEGTVYINGDILNAEYQFVKDISAAAQASQQRLENSYKRKAQKLQQDVGVFQQKASQGLLSENQAMAQQESLMKRKEELDKMDLKMQSLMQEFQQKNLEVRASVVNYLKEYNKTANYQYVLTYTDGPGGVVVLADSTLDITSEVLVGLNEEYAAKKEAAKAPAAK